MTNLVRAVKQNDKIHAVCRISLYTMRKAYDLHEKPRAGKIVVQKVEPDESISPMTQKM
jgi:hypothetical protein